MTTATETPTLPSRDELHEAWEALAEGWDEKGADLVRRLSKFVNVDNSPPVSMEEIGALLVFINETRGLVGAIECDLSLLEEVTLEDLAEVERDGSLGHVPVVDEIGIRRCEV